VPYCRHCGGFHADDASYCPFCGQAIGEAPSEPPPAGVPEVFGRTLQAAWQRRPWSLLAIAFVGLLAILVVAAAGVAITAYATFGTLHPHAIVDTHCFVRTGDLNGAGTTFRMRQGCDVFPLHASAAGLVIAAVGALLVLLVAWTALQVVLLRRCDREFGSHTAWPLLPTLPAIARASGRVLGWGIVAMLAWTLAITIPILIVASTANSGAPPAVQATAILAEVAGMAFLAIWWIVPFLIRAGLAAVGMLTDDRTLVAAWHSLAPSRGQLWAFLGLEACVVISFTIANQLVSAVFGNLGALVIAGGLISAALQLVAFVLNPALEVATMRFFQGGGGPRAADAP
jgi:hypothetical protein